jgi:hypothetical protein
VRGRIAPALGVAAAIVGGLLVGRDRSHTEEVIRTIQPNTGAVPVSASTLSPILTRYNVRGFDPHDIDLASVVPDGGVVDGAWFVPAGTTVPQLAVAWHRGRGDARTWDLTLWTPEKARNPGTRWRPQRLIKRSPIPIVDWEGKAGVRLADVTGDGHDDLLVSLGLPGSNHVATLISVFSGSRPYDRIYGFGYAEVDKQGRRAFGRLIPRPSGEHVAGFSGSRNPAAARASAARTTSSATSSGGTETAGTEPASGAFPRTTARRAVLD